MGRWDKRLSQRFSSFNTKLDFYILYYIIMGEEKKRWLIPFSLQEVKVGDILVSWMNRRYYRVIEKDINYLYPVKVKIINKNRKPWMEFWTGWEWYYIDRRPRYKRILDSLLWIRI